MKIRILETLEKGHLMSLATHDADGVWVSDLIYVYDDDLNIYWISSTETRHSKAVALNKDVAGTITVSAKSKEPNLGIQFSGTAQKIDGPRFDLAKKHMKKRGNPEPAETEDILKGRSWYMLKPTKLYLIDEENFGFKRQTIEL
jgi:uncharacterized protein YhbP (UPF0306 family)